MCVCLTKFLKEAVYSESESLIVLNRCWLRRSVCLAQHVNFVGMKEEKNGESDILQCSWEFSGMRRGRKSNPSLSYSSKRKQQHYRKRVMLSRHPDANAETLV